MQFTQIPKSLFPLYVGYTTEYAAKVTGCLRFNFANILKRKNPFEMRYFVEVRDRETGAKFKSTELNRNGFSKPETAFEASDYYVKYAKDFLSLK